MNEGRLGTVHKQETSNRKFMYIMNDVAKFRQEELNHYYDQIERDELQRKEKSARRIRKKAVNSYVLGKCLAMNRENTLTSPTGNLFGRYNGRPIASFSTEVQSYITHKSPKVRKQREMENLLKRYKESGKILEEDQIKDKVRGYLSTRWGVEYKTDQKEDIEPEKPTLPQIRITNRKVPDIFSFYKTTFDARPKGRAVDRRPSMLEIRDENGQYIPMDSVNALRSHRGSIFPAINNLQKRRGTIRRPSELPQLPLEGGKRKQNKFPQVAGQPNRRKSILPPIT